MLHLRSGNDKLEPNKNRYFRSRNGNTWVCCASCQPGKNGLRTGKCNQCYGSDRSLDNYKIDVNSLMNALKAKYPKLAALTGAEDRDLIGTLKELKDAKETAKTIEAANILRDLIQYKALENMQ